MSVQTVKAGIQVIQAAVPGVKQAFLQVPNSLTMADCPAFITLTGSAQYDWKQLGRDWWMLTRIYTMRLYLQPVVLGYPGEGEAIAELFFESVRVAFGAYPSLGVAGVQSAELMDDSGVKVVDYQTGQPFWAVDYRLGVVEYVERQYAAGE